MPVVVSFINHDSTRESSIRIYMYQFGFVLLEHEDEHEFRSYIMHTMVTYHQAHRMLSKLQRILTWHRAGFLAIRSCQILVSTGTKLYLSRLRETSGTYVGHDFYPGKSTLV